MLISLNSNIFAFEGGFALPFSEIKTKVTEFTDKVARTGEIIIAVLLLIILFIGIASFGIQIFSGFSEQFYEISQIRNLIDKALIILLIIELYTITVSYLKDKPVIKEVFIASFIAVGRKILIYEYEKWGLTGAIALAVLLITLSGGYYLLHRASFGREKQS